MYSEEISHIRKNTASSPPPESTGFVYFLNMSGRVCPDGFGPLGFMCEDVLRIVEFGIRVYIDLVSSKCPSHHLKLRINY